SDRARPTGRPPAHPCRASCSKPPPAAQAAAGKPSRPRQAPTLLLAKSPPLPSPALIVVGAAAKASSVHAAEQDAGVVAAEPHRIREGDLHVGFPRLVGDVVEVTD